MGRRPFRYFTDSSRWAAWWGAGSTIVTIALAERADLWFAAWSGPDGDRREKILASIVSPRVGFRDRFSLIE